MNHFQRNLKEVLKRTAGQFMTVTFIKKDGTERTLNCKYGKVPGHDGYNPVSGYEQYLTVSLSQKGKNGETLFRNIDVEKIRKVKVGGMTLTFE